VWLIEAVRCFLDAPAVSNCALGRAIDGRIMRFSTTSSCQSSDTSEIVKHSWWRRFGTVGSEVDHINEVTLRRALLVLGWVTVSGFNSRCGKFISSNQPPRSSQPVHRYVGRCNEYRPNGDIARRLGVKAGMARVWWQVTCVNPCITRAISERFRG